MHRDVSALGVAAAGIPTGGGGFEEQKDLPPHFWIQGVEKYTTKFFICLYLEKY